MFCLFRRKTYVIHMHAHVYMLHVVMISLFQVDLIIPHEVRSIAVQGAVSVNNYPTTVKVDTSNDSLTWDRVKDDSGDDKVRTVTY